MSKNKFELRSEKDKLFAIFTIEGKSFDIDVTDYFSNDNPLDDWLDYRIFQDYKKCQENIVNK